MGAIHILQKDEQYMPKLSIIIPVYNMSAQANHCLSTIRKTVRLPYEVIIIDDGSPADECTIVSSAEDDVRVIRCAAHRGFSHAVNTGIRSSAGEVLLFLHADILLAPHTAEDMLDALINDPALGAVCAVAPFVYERAQLLPDPPYQSWDSYVAVAEEIRAKESVPHPELFAEMIALMVRRDALDAAGFLDEAYSVPALAAYDYTLRMTRAGYGMASLPSVYVHHNDGLQDTEEYARICEKERALFHTKWGISLDYSFLIRKDLFPLMDLQREGLRILEIGCACGATLREIGMQNPTAKLYGVEMNESAAVIAAPFAKILSMNVERLELADITERFDYIIMGDVIEHLLEPWTAIYNMRELLVPGGAIIASIPNVAHISNLYYMLCGRWTYEDAGLLDRTHFRFFTKYEIVKLFEEAGFTIEQIESNKQELSDGWQRFREEILSLHMVDVNPEDLDAYQWLVRAQRT